MARPDLSTVLCLLVLVGVLDLREDTKYVGLVCLWLHVQVKDPKTVGNRMQEEVSLRMIWYTVQIDIQSSVHCHR